MVKGLTIFAVILIILVIICSMFGATIKPGYVGVVYSASGGLEDQVLGQGWHMKAPWKSIISYPISTETVYLSKSVKEGSTDDESVNAGSSDGKQINMDISYTYHFNPDKVKDIFAKFRGQSADIISDTYIRRSVKNNLNAISTQYGVFDIYGIKRSEVATNTYKALIKDLESDGILIESFNITEVRPDANTVAAIQDKINSEQSLAKMKIDAEKNIVQANNDKEKADIAAQQAVTTAKGLAESAKIAADAQNYANMKMQQSITPELIQYTLATKWNGQQPLVSGNGGQILNLGDLMTKK